MVEERVVKEGARKPRRLRCELPPLTLLAAALVRGRDGGDTDCIYRVKGTEGLF